MAQRQVAQVEVADDVGMGRGHRPQGIDGALRGAFRHIADDGVHQHRADDDGGVDQPPRWPPTPRINL